MNQRGFTWLDDSVEHSEEDEARAIALARRWSSIHDEVEQEQFARQADYEDDRDGWEYEPEPCEVCGGDCFVVPESHQRNSRGHLLYYSCSSPACDGLVNIKCPNPDCEDGYDVAPIRGGGAPGSRTGGRARPGAGAGRG